MRRLLRRAPRFDPGLRWILACAALVTPADAFGQALPGGTRLSYTRAPGTEMCLDEEGFRNLVASHLPGGADPFTPDGVWETNVTVARQGRGFRGEIQLFDGDGRRRGRNVYTGATCAAVMEDVGAMVGLALLPPPQPIASATPPPPEAPAAAVAPTAPTAAPASAPERTTPPASPAEQPDAAREGRSPVRPAPEPRASRPGAQPLGAMRSQAIPGSPATRPRLTLGLGPLLGFGFLPAGSLGLTGFAGARWPTTSLLVELRGDRPLVAAPSTSVPIETSWFGGSFIACHHANTLFACGLATAGRIRGVALNYESGPGSASRYVGLGLRTGLEVPFSSRLTGQLAGDVLLTVVAPRLTLGSPPLRLGRQEEWSAPALSAVVSLRLVASF